MQVFRQLGVKNSDILERWFTGPAFLPWFRMGNLIRWGGPLSQEYIDNQVKQYECTAVNVVNKNLKSAKHPSVGELSVYTITMSLDVQIMCFLAFLAR